MLDISKLDSGGIQANYSVFDLKQFIDDLLLELDSVAADKKIELFSNTPTIMVLSDRQLLFSVMQNLISNAIRYTHKGGRVEIVAEESVNDDDQLARICVIDNGIGIEQHDLDKIFNEFYQIKAPATGSVGGLGLGLSIVERISRLLDLQVSVESTFGKGSQFSVELPISTQDVAITPSASERKFVAPTEKLSGLKILYIDNDDSVLNGMKALLEGWGCVVRCVTTYKQGVEFVSKASYQIILADYRLDYEETGLDFLRFAKELDKQAAVHGVLITAEQDKNIETQAIGFGFNYLAKPVQPVRLKSMIFSLLDKIEENEHVQQ